MAGARSVGPESTKYAADRSVIKDIFTLIEYRESADPPYPEARVNTFKEVFSFLGVKGAKPRIGVAGYLVSNPIQLEGLKSNFPESTIVRQEEIVRSLRAIKSVNELACMREGYRITELAIEDVVKAIRPGHD